MILVKPSHEILTEIDGERILKNIEAAGRTCYKSEDKITEDSAKKFIARKMRELMAPLRDELKKMIPIIFDDI